MIRHATKPKTDRAPNRHTHRPRASCLYTVEACPDNLYARGAQFGREAVYDGLAWANWPEGMRFVAPTGEHLVVQACGRGWQLKETHA